LFAASHVVACDLKAATLQTTIATFLREELNEENGVSGWVLRLAALRWLAGGDEGEASANYKDSEVEVRAVMLENCVVESQRMRRARARR
jgi:hypothetical protein